MRKCIKNYSTEYSKDTYNYILSYLNQYNKCKNIFYNLYQNNISYINVPYKHEIRDNLVSALREGSLPIDISNALQRIPAKLQKCALTEAITNLKANQSNVKNRIKLKTNSNLNFTKRDKYYIRYVLTSNEYLHKLNLNKPLDMIEKFNDVDQHKLNSYIKRQLKIEKFKKPYAKGSSFTIDSASQSRYVKEKDQLYIYLPTTVLKKRVKVPLTNPDLLMTGDIKVVVKSYRIELHKAIEIVPNKVVGDKTISIYIDFDNLIHTSTGHVYGSNLSSMLNKYANRVNTKQFKRDKLKLVNSKNVINNNLGTIKWDKFKTRVLDEIKSYINSSINELIKNENINTVVMQPINKFLVASNKTKLDEMTDKYMQRLNNWLIKYITTRLEYKFNLNCINLVLVNSACTSKECYNCGSLSTKVTNGFFKCNKCMVSTNRITNILSNVLSRHGDKEITQTSSYKDVVRLLEHRSNVMSGLT